MLRNALIFLLVFSKAVTAVDVLAGYLYLSYNYLGFYAEITNKKVQVLIPLREISFIGRAMIGKSVKESQPNIIPYNPMDTKISV